MRKNRKYSKKILCEKEYKDIKLKDLFLAFSCGEPFELNEEKLINKATKIMKKQQKNSLLKMLMAKCGEI